MLVYILKSTFCLVLLLGLYHIFLEKEKMHQFNRFYLLGSIVFSFLVPTFTITVAPTETLTPIASKSVDFTAVPMNTTEITTATPFDYTPYFYGAYLIISSILLLFLFQKIIKILKKVKYNKNVNYFSATVVLLKERIIPYTFLHYIFINKHSYQTDSVEQQILTHELAHVNQKHSIDVLFIEILQTLFWFNPIFRLYKKAIQLNHEFLADDAVIKSHKNITEYQHVLLNTTAQHNNIYLASNLNYSLTKKRLLMMTTPSSKTKILLKKLLVFPLVAGFIFAFAERVEAQEKKSKPQIIEVQQNKKGISKKEMRHYNLLMSRAKKAKVFMQKDIIEMQNLYRKMSASQQNSVDDIFKVVPPPPPISYKKKVPTTPQFNAWKNQSNYAVWIDGKVVSNATLNNYKNTDFSYYTASSVTKTARSKRFPQPYQIHLHTNSSFKKLKARNQRVTKNVVRIFINKSGSLLVNNKVTKISNLIKQLESTKIDKEKSHIVISKDKAVSEDLVLKITKMLRQNEYYKITVNTKLLPPPPPMDIVYTYKRLAKKVQQTPKNRKANVIYLKRLYTKMNASQKKKVKKPAAILSKVPVKIEVIEKKSKGKLSKKAPLKKVKRLEEVEEVIVEEIEEVEIPIVEEIKEVKEIEEVEEVEVLDKIEMVEVEEIIEEPKNTEVIEIIEEEEIEDDLAKSRKNTNSSTTKVLDLKSIKDLDFDKIVFYINNKKVSKRKVEKLPTNKLKTLTIKKGKGQISHIYITLNN